LRSLFTEQVRKRDGEQEQTREQEWYARDNASRDRGGTFFHVREWWNFIYRSARFQGLFDYRYS